MTSKKSASKPAKPIRASRKPSQGFTTDERAAMRERVKELKGAGSGQDAEAEVVAKIAALPPADREIGRRLHEIIRASAPSLTPKLWYGMPAYARDGKVVCYFQSAQKFKSRYATLGFSDQANLDEGAMWPTVFALKTVTAAEEARIAALLKRAVG
ncbi:MAG TPA: DUF1801 domain-containing protein [Vicinamibacterales bacterium]|jgi:uncharacterized protein YdhG (YjbR/CyaY superfamily)